MKKYLYLSFVFVCSLFIGLISVNAEDYYYINDNGVTFTKNQYDFITKMYFEGYQTYMTQEDMNYFNDIKMVPENVESKEYVEMYHGEYSTRATTHETQSKILKISKINKTISISCAWKKSPTVRSYDLIGTYLNGPSLYGGASARIAYSGGSISPSYEKTPGNGYGAVIKMPTGGNSIIASTTFTVTGSGRVYGSYQHAASSISLNNAKKFTIGNGGLGNVFKFSSPSIASKYDGMGGVYTDV